MVRRLQPVQMGRVSNTIQILLSGDEGAIQGGFESFRPPLRGKLGRMTHCSGHFHGRRPTLTLKSLPKQTERFWGTSAEYCQHPTDPGPTA